MKPNANGKSGGGEARTAAGRQAGRGRRPPTGKPLSARELALEALNRVETEGAYSNLLLNGLLRSNPLDRADAALATELVYGTIQRRRTLDYFLARFVAKGWDKLEIGVRNLLRMSLYQIHYLDRIPDHAAVNEAVAIAKRRGHAGISGLVNAVLRNIVRRKAELVVPQSLAPVERIALEHSYPDWLVAEWVRRFGPDTAERMCRAGNEPPHASARVNTLKLTQGELLTKLREAGYDARPSELSPAGVVVSGGGNLAHTPSYAAGELSVQDESSMLVAELVDPRPGMRVLDCCAAPGGKTTHMAELMGDEGEIMSCDIHEHKRKLIEDQARRLGLRSVKTRTVDARLLAQTMGGTTFDRVLLDAPCSGLGVIRRKPDIKWTKKPEDVADVARLQYELLCGAAELVAPGGLLVYSTCTIAEEENERNVERFLKEHPQFELAPPPEPVGSRLAAAGLGTDGIVTVLPHRFGSDGFFIARLARRP